MKFSKTSPRCHSCDIEDLFWHWSSTIYCPMNISIICGCFSVLCVCHSEYRCSMNIFIYICYYSQEGLSIAQLFLQLAKHIFYSQYFYIQMSLDFFVFSPPALTLDYLHRNRGIKIIFAHYHPPNHAWWPSNLSRHQWPLLLILINFNPNMDK